MKMKVVVDPDAYMPTRAHETDAGLDLYSPIETMIGWPGSKTGNSVSIDTGVHIQIPAGYVGFIKSKSGLMVKYGITTDGTIDSGYTGSIVVKLFNHGDKALVIEKGDKIAQLVLLPIITPELERVGILEETERGDNGFGSTGR